MSGKVDIQERASDPVLKQMDGKIDTSLSPVFMDIIISMVFEAGIKQGYTPNSWKEIKDPNIFAHASRRHLSEIILGNEIDTKSGLPHCFHVACDAAMLCHEWLERHNKTVSPYKGLVNKE